MAAKTTAKSFLRLGKFLGSLICWIVLSFWASQAVEKYLSNPVSSSISFTNGDDGLENLNYPAISICAIGFTKYLNKILVTENQRCQSNLNNFADILRSNCLSMGTIDEKTTTTTEDYNGFGNLFGDGGGYDYWEADEFQTVEEALNRTQVKISDMIEEFHYGKQIGVSPQYDKDSQQAFWDNFWVLTYDQRKGPCYTFDPYRNNVSLMSSGSDTFGTFEPTTIQIKFKFDWFKTKSPSYELSFHHALEDRFDRLQQQPFHWIRMDKTYEIELTKIKFDSLNQEDFKCSEDDFYGPLKSKLYEVGLKIISKYNCTLPWMSQYEFPNVTSCEVDSVPNVSNNTDFHFTPIDHIVKNWTWSYERSEKFENTLPCKRTVYNSMANEQSIDIEGYNESWVSIKYGTPYVQNVKDYLSYDMQSLIGEVGGTLRLLLGFSFISVFDLFEYVVSSCYKKK